MIEEKRLWDLWRSGQMPFAEFQQRFEKLTGEPMPDDVGRLGVGMGPITKKRHDYLQKLGAEVAGRVIRRQPQT